MKSTHCLPLIQRHAASSFSHKHVTTGLAIALALAIPQGNADAATQFVDLNGATNFAVLAGSGITIAAPVNSTFITGDIGTYAITTISGLENLVLDGVNHAGDAVTQQGKIDLGSAYVDAAGRTADVMLLGGQDLAGETLVPGVYSSPTSLFINGALTLDAGGDPNAVWIFQMDSTLTTGSGSSVDLINGAQAGNVFWQVGSSATLGTSSHLEGTILAQTSISATTGATFNGRLLALDGAVTLDNNTIIIPEPSSAALVALGISFMTLTRRRKPQAS